MKERKKDFEKEMLIKLMKKDFEMIWKAKNVEKVELVNLLIFFLGRTKALSDL